MILVGEITWTTSGNIFYCKNGSKGQTFEGNVRESLSVSFFKKKEHILKSKQDFYVFQVVQK